MHIRRGCEGLSRTMRELGFMCTALHSKMPQNDRLASLAKFRSSLVQILVATDVASRCVWCVRAPFPRRTFQLAIHLSNPQLNEIHTQPRQ